jgi:hypothetical protein
MKPWLISNEELDSLRNSNGYDYISEVYNSNGITSPESAYWALFSIRFEYTTEDCIHCESKESYKIGDIWKCKSCRKKFTLTSGSYLDNTKLEYYEWWRFAYLVGEMKITNSCVIANDLGVTQKTAWGMLNLLRTARKETCDIKFVNGKEALAFNHIWEVLELLIKKKPNISKEITREKVFMKVAI